MTMHRLKCAAMLIAFVLFGLASFGYAQDDAEQSTAETNPVTAWFWEFLVILGVLIILAALVFLGFQTVRQQKALQGWNAASSQLRHDLTQRLERVEKVGRDNASGLKETREAQENIRDTLAQTNTRLHNLEAASQDSASDEGTEDTWPIYRREAETAVRDAREQVSVLARTYREGQPIELGELETSTPSQNVLGFLNLLARDIGKWKTEVVQTDNANPELVDVLTYREADITAKLQELRGESPPSPPPLSVETTPKTESELNAIRNACTVYVAQFQGMLIGYELGRKVDIAEYDAFLPQFIADRLFNGVARCMPFEELSQRMDKFLRLVGYEVVPIQIGHTKADSRVHEIQGSRQTGDEPGTIVEVVSPGLQQHGGGDIVQKPVVIRGE